MVEDISIDCICMSVEIERHTVGSRTEEMKVVAQKHGSPCISFMVGDDPEDVARRHRQVSIGGQYAIPSDEPLQSYFRDGGLLGRVRA